MDTPRQQQITLEQAQRMVDEWITTVGVRYFSPLTNMAILAEETGEVARVMARRYGDQSSKPTDTADLADELAGRDVGDNGHSQPDEGRPHGGFHENLEKRPSGTASATGRTPNWRAGTIDRTINK